MKRNNDYLAPKKKYLFDPRKLDEIRRNALGRPLPAMFDFIVKELDKTYPGHICLKQDWLFNNAGGAMGQLALVHGSIREYIIFFGTCIGTEGHSGRYSAEVYDFMLQGEMRCEYEGRFEPDIYTPHSEPAYLGSKVIKHYCIKNDAWMMEYARGTIAKMLPFGLSDSIFSTLDIRTLCRLISNYGKLAIRELFTKGKDTAAAIKLIAFIAAVILFVVYVLPRITAYLNR